MNPDVDVRGTTSDNVYERKVMNACPLPYTTACVTYIITEKEIDQ
jgi:hypothetical protein